MGCTPAGTPVWVAPEVLWPAKPDTAVVGRKPLWMCLVELASTVDVVHDVIEEYLGSISGDFQIRGLRPQRSAVMRRSRSETRPGGRGLGLFGSL